MKIKYKTLIPAILIPLAVGGLSALITNSAMKNFENVTKPIPVPGILFPIVWTVLYVLMGIASYFVLEANAPWDEKRKALIVYGIQLALNFFWSIIFFNLQAYLFAFVWILLLIAAVIWTMVKFAGISKTAVYLFIPYLAWICFAAYLNLGITVLN